MHCGGQVFWVTKALQPLYQPTSRKILSNQLLPAICDSAATKLKEMLQKAEYVSVTTDIWTSDSNKSFLTVTCHFVHNFKHSAVLNTIEVQVARAYIKFVC